MRDLFGLDCVITLYDLTNTYLEGRAEVNPQARHGHSKEKRADCPLAALALVLDGSGFVRRSEVFTGNAGEAQTLNEMLSGLDAPTGALVVMDRGIISQATIDWLAAPGYRYRVVSRTRRRHFDADAATPITTTGGERVHLPRVASADGRERYGYCHSEARARKEQAIEERFAQRFETELQRIHEGLSRPQTLKRIGRLKEKSRGIGQYYTLERVPEERGDKAIAVHWQRRTPPNSRAHYPGVYCFCAPMKRMWRTYLMLTDREAVFRALKSELGLRPIFHQKQHRSAGHLFITVLAYQFVPIIRRHLHGHGITESWSRLREPMGSQCRISATFRRADGRILHVRKATLPEPHQKPVYQALGIDPLPGGVRKMIV